MSCNDDDDEDYPSLITELAMARADNQGLMTSFTTDDGIIYHVNNEIKGMTANSRIRALISYLKTDAPDGAPAENSFAIVYQAKAVPVFWDWTTEEPMRRDPTGIQSVWVSGGFVNLHLTPKTQGGKQAWGFTRDSVTTNVLGTTTHHLSLYHHQLEDATAYTTDLYACISLDSIPALAAQDSIRLTVNTFSTPAIWMFGL
jgi:hypothetical protein